MIKFNCLRCGHFADSHGDSENLDTTIQPRIGDCMICIRCGAPHVFLGLDKLNLVRRMTFEEFAKLSNAEKTEIAKTVLMITTLPGKMSEK